MSSDIARLPSYPPTPETNIKRNKPFEIFNDIQYAVFTALVLCLAEGD